MSIRKSIYLFACLALLSTMIGGYFYLSSARSQAQQKEHREADNFLKAHTIHIATHIESFQREARILTGLNAIKAVFAEPNQQNLDQANSTLDFFNSPIEADACYLMDASGLTIASSNRNDEISFVGKNYGFRHYFQEAMQGRPNIYLAVGVTSGIRGVFSSHPVYRKGTDIITGVAVIKYPISRLLEEHGTVDNGILIFSDPNGFLFMSSRQDWLYKLLWEPSPAVIDTISKSRQFGTGPWQWIGMKRIDEDHAQDADGVHYRIHQQTINSLPDWKIIYFHNLQDVAQKIYGPLFQTTAMTIAALLLLTAVIIAFLYKSASRDLQQRKIAEEALLVSEQKLRSMFDHANDSIVIIDPETYHFLDCNINFAKRLGYTKEEILHMTPADINDELPTAKITSILQKQLAGEEILLETVHQRKDGSRMPVEVSSALIEAGPEKFIQTFIRDITERKQAELEKERLISDLQNALSEIKSLRGILPICASCKKIRDDQGYWNRIESYIEAHSDAEFSHSVCPECAKKLYPEFADDMYPEEKINTSGE